MSYIHQLTCKECGTSYIESLKYVCDFCFGPLEVYYNYEAIQKVLTKEVITSRQKNLWRYKELLPVKTENFSNIDTGFTPLIHAKKLGAYLGLTNLYIKFDGINYPTLSFKDRVVAVSVEKAKEFGLDTIACASTGNLANSVAAQAAQAGLKSYVFIPSTLEPEKILNSAIYTKNVVRIDGNYDQVNRLCSEIADKYKWAFVNINLRPYYAEGSKTVGHEIAEQLGWKAPDNIVAPMAGGSLLTKIYKGIKEFETLSLIPFHHTKIFGAQATGCNPITELVKSGEKDLKPVKPNTLVKSLAIGNPADGHYAAHVIKTTGGWAEDVSDDAVLNAIKLLAQTEGIFTEPAGGTTLASFIRLLDQGYIPKHEKTVLVITGNGLKTQGIFADHLKLKHPIGNNLKDFEQEYLTEKILEKTLTTV